MSDPVVLLVILAAIATILAVFMGALVYQVAVLNRDQKDRADRVAAKVEEVKRTLATVTGEGNRKMDSLATEENLKSIAETNQPNGEDATRMS
jgi:predicted PurR-regulated permease PerM